MWIWAAIFSVVIVALSYTFISKQGAKDVKSVKAKKDKKVPEKATAKTNGKTAPVKKGKQETKPVAQPAKVEPKSEPKQVESVSSPTKSKKNKNKAQKAEPVVEVEPEVVVPEVVEEVKEVTSPKPTKAKKNKKKSNADKSKNEVQANQESTEVETEHLENGNVLDDATFVTPQKVASTKFDRSNIKGAKVSKPVESTNPWALLGEVNE